MFVPGAWRELWTWVCRRPCLFRGQGGSCVLGLSVGHVGFQGMPGSLIPWLLPAVLDPGARRELWVQGFSSAMFVARACAYP